MMTWWCEKGIDGFRMDVISLISKPESFDDLPTGGGLYGDWNFAANGPHVHEYLEEMHREVLGKYDLMTVGETSAVTLEEAKKYANSRDTELNMVFQFEHVGLDDGDGMKWSTRRMPLVPLKENLTKWQLGLDGLAWNSLFFCNHDQPRIINRLGSTDEALRERSAKCIATALHMMQGTPYIYEGEELGMTNYPFTSPDEFHDVESINAYRELTEEMHMDPKELFPMIAHKSRDNARTPMQWNDGTNAGFSDGTPWIMVNPNYTSINAEEQMNRSDSVFHYYQKLIQLRHSSDLIVYGHYELLLPEDPDLFVYRRFNENGAELLVVCNLPENERAYELPDHFKDGSILIHNMVDSGSYSGILRPYETMVIKAARSFA